MSTHLKRHLFAGLAVSGCGCLYAGTALHPHSADPNDALAAFTEYAASHNWVCTHLIQLLGVTLITFALVLLGRSLRGSRGEATAELAVGMAWASLALAAALQAVDGIALKTMVAAWAAAPLADKPALFAATLAVRQVEIGFAAMGGCAFGVTTLLYGLALWQDGRFPKPCALLALIGGGLFFAGGLIMAHDGFSGPAMTCTMLGGSLVILWLLWLAISTCRTSPSA